ncbi:MAG: ferritin-like domain-containing protein [Candidatus Limnocylindria bacterium]
MSERLGSPALAPAEPPIVVEHRDALIYLLREAAELEHGIMCQYLYAAFTLKESTDEGLTVEQLEAVGRWRTTILEVARQEMLHLALVQNLLTSVGAAPHFGRPNLPAPAHRFPGGVQLALIPFGERALRHFLFLERPEGMALEDAEGFGAAVARARPLMGDDDIVPRYQEYSTVGHLYRAIDIGFAWLTSKLGEGLLFIGPPDAQATPESFRWPELIAVRDLDSVHRAVDTIVEQGEGAKADDWREAHFGRFLGVLDEYLALRQRDPGFDPVRPVLPGTMRPHAASDTLPLIGDTATAQVADLFNVTYQITLLALARYFAHTDESPAQLNALADVSVGLMFVAIKPLGQLLTRLPFGPEHAGRTAGPTFELFYQSGYVLPDRRAAWTLIEERLRQAAEYARKIDSRSDPVIAKVANALDKTADRLANASRASAQA